MRAAEHGGMVRPRGRTPLLAEQGSRSSPRSRRAIPIPGRAPKRGHPILGRAPKRGPVGPGESAKEGPYWSRENTKEGPCQSRENTKEGFSALGLSFFVRNDLFGVTCGELVRHWSSLNWAFSKSLPQRALLWHGQKHQIALLGHFYRQTRLKGPLWCSPHAEPTPNPSQTRAELALNPR